MRARNIKPDFYRDVDLAECSIAARWLTPGLWMLADKEGRLKDNPRQIKMDLCPCDTVDIEKCLEELADARHITRYEAEGARVIQIRNFKKHQNPHRNEKASLLPPLPDSSGNSPKISDSSESSPSAPADSLNPDSLKPESESISLGSKEPNSSSPAADDAPGGPAQEPDNDATDQKQKGKNDTHAPKHSPCPYGKIAEAYNTALSDKLPEVREVTDRRRGVLQARWRSKKERQNLEWWREYFELVARSPFLTGQDGKSRFRATFDWLINPSNMVKVLEGNYHDDQDERQCEALAATKAAFAKLMEE